MNYQYIKSTNAKVSILGFGMMRLPIIDKDTKKIDKDKAIKMVRTAIDAGLNYIDTAYPYHGEMSEPFTAEALKEGYREKVHLATKLPLWLVKTQEDAERLFNEQLSKLQTDHIDFYLLHALNKKQWENIVDLGLLKWMDKLKTSGKIIHAGFSFHDDLELFKKILDAYDWDFCQIQYNFMNQQYQAGKEGLHYANNKGISVIVMEPLFGGKLAKTPPPTIAAIWQKSTMKNQSPPERALKWVWNQPEVTLLLSGMSTLEQVEENLSIASKAETNILSDEEKNVYKEIEAEYNRIMPIACTDCKYCLPCPYGVLIPNIFSLYNQGKAYDDMDGSKFVYNNYIAVDAHADKCVACGECEEKCPQNIEIIDWLSIAEKAFA